MASLLSGRVRLGVFELDLKSGELRSLEAPTAKAILLREQVLQVLQLLVERGGKIVTREEIKARLWPNDTVVDFDHSINATIKSLRRALGDSADKFPVHRDLGAAWLSIDGRDRVPGVRARNRFGEGPRAARAVCGPDEREGGQSSAANKA
jgi:Transcriptional regulatory protein, C terminal